MYEFVGQNPAGLRDEPDECPSELPDELRIVAMASGALVALLNTTNNRCYSTLREFFPPSHTCIYE